MTASHCECEPYMRQMDGPMHDNCVDPEQDAFTNGTDPGNSVFELCCDTFTNSTDPGNFIWKSCSLALLVLKCNNDGCG